MVTTIVNVAGTPFAFYGIEKFGRRALLIWGALGMCVCEFIIAIIGISSDSNVATKVLIAFVCVYVFFFAATWVSNEHDRPKSVFADKLFYFAGSHSLGRHRRDIPTPNALESRCP